MSSGNLGPNSSSKHEASFGCKRSFWLQSKNLNSDDEIIWGNIVTWSNSKTRNKCAYNLLKFKFYDGCSLWWLVFFSIFVFALLFFFVFPTKSCLYVILTFRFCIFKCLLTERVCSLSYTSCSLPLMFFSTGMRICLHDRIRQHSRI